MRIETADEAALRRELYPLIEQLWHARIAYETARERLVLATRDALGIGRVALVAGPGWEEQDDYALMDAPWMRLIRRAEYPPVVVCGLTEEACSYRPRPGPNGPIDSDQWVKRAGERCAK